ACRTVRGDDVAGRHVSLSRLSCAPLPLLPHRSKFVVGESPGSPGAEEVVLLIYLLHLHVDIQGGVADQVPLLVAGSEVDTPDLARIHVEDVPEWDVVRLVNECGGDLRERHAAPEG